MVTYIACPSVQTTWQRVLAAGRVCHLFLISAAMVMKACSTLVAFLALVSKKGMPISSAKACAPIVAWGQDH